MLAGVTGRAEWDSEKYLVYSMGDLSLRPQLEVAGTYDSNLFYAEQDEVGDFYFSLRPGLTAVYGRQEPSQVSIRYTMDGSIYMERSDLDNLGHLVNHLSRFRFSRWVLEGSDAFSLTRTLLGGSFSYIQRRIGLLSLRDSWRADYEVSPKVVAGMRLGLNMVDYEAADLAPNHLYDYLNYLVGARAGYLPSDKIVLYPELTFGQSFLEPNSANYADSPDMTFYAFAVGAEGDFTAKLKGTVSAGYEIRTYADGTEIPDGWVANLQLRWLVRPKTALAVEYRHFIQPSQEAGGVSYTAHRPTVSLTQEFGTQGRWSARLDGYYEFDDYEPYQFTGGTSRRQNDQAGVSLRANYRWQPWLTVAAGYDFFTYSDNLVTVPDYDVHRFSLRFIGGY